MASRSPLLAILIATSLSAAAPADALAPDSVSSRAAQLGSIPGFSRHRDPIDPRAHPAFPDRQPLRSRSWQPGDQYWSDDFELPQVNGYVLCAIEYGGKLIIGGSFSRVGLANADNIAAWDGSQWSEFGGGTDSRVETFHLFEDDLIIGGYFGRAGNVSARGVARWNGSAWSALGAGLGEAVTNPYGAPGAKDFATFQGVLVACGEFWSSGSVPVSFLAQWNGSTWTPLLPEIDAPVLALETVADTLYFGGYFQNVGAQSIRGLARWDGSLCTAVGGGLDDTYGAPSVFRLLRWGDKVVASGNFELADSIPAYGIAAWNGTSWESLGSLYGYYFWTYAMVVEGNDLVIASNGAVFRRTGDTWTEYGSGLVGYPYCLAIYQSHLFAGGDLWIRDPQGKTTAQGLAIYSGGAWNGLIPWSANMHGLSAGNSVEVAALETYRDRLVAFGSFYYSGNPPNYAEARMMASWDGSSWSQFPLPRFYGFWATALTARQDSLYLAGLFRDPQGNESPVIRFDGAAWAWLDTLSVVAKAMAFYDGDLYIGGERLYQPGYTTEIHRYRGGHWERVGVVGVGSGYGTIEAMVVHEGKLFVGGLFEGISDVVSTSIAAWNGSQWEAVGLPPTPASPIRIRSLAVHQGALVAAGDMPYGQSVLRRDGGSWSPMGEVYAYGGVLASVGGELYLGGRIWPRGGTDFDDGIARWDGREWSSMGSGVNSEVLALEPWRGSLYLGGRFTRAGVNGSMGIAQWDGLSSAPGSPRLTLAPGAPNPFRASSSFHYRLSEAGTVRVSVHDVRGREIRIIEQADHGTGDHTVSWDGRTRSGESAPSGVYYVRIRLPDGTERSQKAVLLR